jgi:integrase/recombinase XerD
MARRAGRVKAPAKGSRGSELLRKLSRPKKKKHLSSKVRRALESKARKKSPKKKRSVAELIRPANAPGSPARRLKRRARPIDWTTASRSADSVEWLNRPNYQIPVFDPSATAEPQIDAKDVEQMTGAVSEAPADQAAESGVATSAELTLEDSSLAEVATGEVTELNEVVAEAEVLPMSGPEFERTLEPTATPADQNRDWLPSVELIRPNERMRSAIDGFLLDLRSEHTRRSYARDLKRFMKFLIVRKNYLGPEPINRLVLVAYKESLVGEDLQPTTVDRHLSTLRSFFGWMVEEGLCEKNPAANVRLLSPKRFSKTNAFTDEEVVDLLSRPNLHTRSGAQHYAILMLLFYCGLRRSELCELKTEQLGRERGHRTLRFTGKGDRERIVVLTQEVWNALKYFFLITRRDPRKPGFIFQPTKNNRTGELNKPMDSSTIFYIVRKYAKECGITKKVSPHSCRATAISNARDHQVPDRAIQEFAGWSSPSMLIHYDKRRTAIDESASHSIQYTEGGTRKVLPQWAVDEDDWDVFLKDEEGAPRDDEAQA